MDAPDFDPVAYINTMFPDEDSLSEGKLDLFLKQCKGRMSALSEGVSRDVREHSLQRLKTEKAVKEASSAIHQLFNRIGAIKEKAAQSETMVDCGFFKKAHFFFSFFNLLWMKYDRISL